MKYKNIKGQSGVSSLKSVRCGGGSYKQTHGGGLGVRAPHGLMD